MTAIALEVLKKARAKISDPSRWIKGPIAVDVNGREVGPGSPNACKWCAEGALISVLVEGPNGNEGGVIWAHKVLSDFVGQPLGRYNDDPKTTHEDILSLFARGIRELSR